MAITGLVYQAYKNAFPELTDEQIVKINDDLELKIPGMADMDPREVAKIAVQLGQNAKAQAAQGPASYAGPASAGRSGYAGTAMAERNAINPQAEHMNAYDPKALDAAYSEYQKKYEATVPERQIRRMMGAGGTELGSRDAATTWGEIDTNNMLQTIGKQAAREAQAAAAGKLAEQNLKNFGQQDTNVQNRQKTEGGAIDLQLKKKLHDPNDFLADMARMSALEQYQITHKSPATDEFKNSLKGQSFMALAPLTTTNFQQAHKLMMDAAKVGMEVTGAQQGQGTVAIRGGAPVSTPPSLPVVPFTPSAGQQPQPPAVTRLQPQAAANAIPAEALPAVQAASAASMRNPKVQETLAEAKKGKEGFKISDGLRTAITPKEPSDDTGTGWSESRYGKKPPASTIYGGSVTAGPMGATVGDDPYLNAKKAQTAEELGSTQAFIENYNKGTKSQVAYVLQNADAWAGRAKQLGSDITNDPVGNKMSNATSVINDAGRHSGLVSGGSTSTSGRILEAGGGAAAGIPHTGVMIAGQAVKALGSTMGTKDAVDASKDAAVIKDLAVRVAVAKAQQEALLPDKLRYSGELNRNLDGFTQTPIYKKITDTKQMVPMINTRSGDVELVSREDKKRMGALKGSGYEFAAKYFLN